MGSSRNYVATPALPIDIITGGQNGVKPQRNGYALHSPAHYNGGAKWGQAATARAVQVLGVGEVRPADGFGHGVFAKRRGHEVNVVRHQAVAVHRETVLRRGLVQQLRVYPAVAVDREKTALGLQRS